jgi:hypothetical protein
MSEQIIKHYPSSLNYLGNMSHINPKNFSAELYLPYKRTIIANDKSHSGDTSNLEDY